MLAQSIGGTFQIDHFAQSQELEHAGELCDRLETLVTQLVRASRGGAEQVVRMCSMSRKVFLKIRSSDSAR